MGCNSRADGRVGITRMWAGCRPPASRIGTAMPHSGGHSPLYRLGEIVSNRHAEDHTTALPRRLPTAWQQGSWLPGTGLTHRPSWSLHDRVRSAVVLAGRAISVLFRARSATDTHGPLTCGALLQVSGSTNGKDWVTRVDRWGHGGATSGPRATGSQRTTPVNTGPPSAEVTRHTPPPPQVVAIPRRSLTRKCSPGHLDVWTSHSGSWPALMPSPRSGPATAR
jgi:hypothetical protein